MPASKYAPLCVLKHLPSIWGSQIFCLGVHWKIWTNATQVYSTRLTAIWMQRSLKKIVRVTPGGKKRRKSCRSMEIFMREIMKAARTWVTFPYCGKLGMSLKE